MTRRLSGASRLAPLAGGAVVLVLSGCTVLGPAYQRPEVPQAESFSVADSGTPANLPNDWWRAFGDGELDRLIDRALEQNADLRIALARVEEVRALAGVTRSQRLPEIGVTAGSSRSGLSEAAGETGPGGPDEVERHQVAATFAWEIDVWGRLRRQTRAAEADLLATEYGAAAVRTSLVAAVTGTYFDLLTLERQLQIARDTTTSRGEALDLQNLRLDSGVISEFEVSQARAELAAARATVPQFEQAVQETRGRLALLLGDVALAERSVGTTDLATMTLPLVPAGLPSTLLERRPDVAAAEQGLIAAHARVGVAKAAYFPSLSLTAAGGSASQEFSDLFSSNASIWNVAANLVGPLFNAGRTGRQVAAARARETQALENYRQLVRSAFVDVQDALSAQRTGAARREALADQAAALADAYRLAQLRYDAGSSSYLEVLDAQRNLFRAQLDLVAAQSGELQSAVRLFQSLGGGFTAAAD
jgi:multidrug efflux system outer membrane protein